MLHFYHFRIFNSPKLLQKSEMEKRGNQSINQSANQSINQPMNQSINQSIN